MRSYDYRAYILINKHCTTLYVGITNNLRPRLSQDRGPEPKRFTKRYRSNRLMWFEQFRNVNHAIACEKKLKGWRRGQKKAFIERPNPRWLDWTDDWEQYPNIYDPPRANGRIIGDSSPHSE